MAQSQPAYPLPTTPTSSSATPTSPGPDIPIPRRRTPRRLALALDGDPDRPLVDTAVSSSTSTTEADSARNSLMLPSSRPFSGLIHDDDISLETELALLDSLRKDVRKNLTLRPIQATTSPSSAHRHELPADLYPLDIIEPTSPEYSTPPSTSSPNSFSSFASSPILNQPSSSQPSPFYLVDHGPNNITASLAATPATSISIRDPSAFSIAEIPSQQQAQQARLQPAQSPTTHSRVRISLPVTPLSLHPSLTAEKRPLVLDTRSTGPYIDCRIVHSINLAIPSLILKRCRKPGGGFSNMDALKPYITTQSGRDDWHDLMDLGTWNSDVVILDQNMDETDPLAPGTSIKPPPSATSSSAWILLSVLSPMIAGQTYFLRGGMDAFISTPHSQKFLLHGEHSDHSSSDTELPYDQEMSEGSDDVSSQHSQTLTLPRPSGPDSASTTPRSAAQLTTPSPRPGEKRGGLFTLRTDVAARSRLMPELERSTTSPLPTPSPRPNQMSQGLKDLSPSPPPLHPPHSPRNPGAPKLRRLDTGLVGTQQERPPKLTLRTQPARSKTLAAPASHNVPHLRLPAASPSHLILSHSPTSPHIHNSPKSLNSPLSPSFPDSRPRSPTTPRTPMPLSPSTARPPLTTPTSPVPAFEISAILPNFLFLGPELTTEEEVQQLMDLGVKRILNLAIECDDDLGLNLRGRFERYKKIPMRDNVEEENIGVGAREACNFLDDARLHSAPTYVHCKAGKSRSVTAVMAYLIHANHWPLKRAYAFVVERRKGISPNIGFMSELMNFEEQELGGKGTAGGANAMTNGMTNGNEEDRSAKGGGNYSHGPGSVNPRRPAHLRESLPPVLTQSLEVMMPGQIMSAGGIPAAIGDSAQETEVKDASGRYRHARRAPVDEQTLQPARRVSKAGLESSSWAEAAVAAAHSPA